jgi:uncharacterized repeat protein (TIGR03837 family)
LTRFGPLQHWVIFCCVVDNHGDLGVCWRLSVQLAIRGKNVTLYVDDSQALNWMAPQGFTGVNVLPWPVDTTALFSDFPTAWVVIEAFGCNIPVVYQTAMASWPHVPVWINLEYFSAEAVAERNHGLPSPVTHGPAKGLTKWFFYPGLSDKTGGVLAPGSDVLSKATLKTPLTNTGDNNTALRICVFCYEPASLGLWLAQLTYLERPVHLSVTAGRATHAVRLAMARLAQAAKLDVTELPYLSHTAFDQLLATQDLNLVRGEDSLVRAIWAGKAFLWQIYPQDDGAHHLKLDAFLKASRAPQVVVQAHLAWNADTATTLPALDPETLQIWTEWAIGLRHELSLQTNLLTRLESFVAAHG